MPAPLILDVEAVRREIAPYLDQSCTVRRPTRTEGPGGRWTITYPQVASGAACRKVELRSSDVEFALQRFGEVTAVILFPHDADRQREDLVDMGGTTYEVRGVTDHAGVYRKAWCFDRRPGSV